MDKKYRNDVFLGLKMHFCEYHESWNHKFVSLLSFQPLELCAHDFLHFTLERTESIHNWVIKRLMRGAKGWKIGKYDIKLPLENFLSPLGNRYKKAESRFFSHIFFSEWKMGNEEENKWKWLWCIDHIS